MEWLALVAAGIIMSLENDLDLFALHTQQPKLSLQKKRRKRGREWQRRGGVVYHHGYIGNEFAILDSCVRS